MGQIRLSCLLLMQIIIHKFKLPVIAVFFFVKEYIGTGLENIKYRFILILLTDLFMFLVHRLILTLNTLNQNTVKFISSLRVIQKIGREKQVLFKGLESPW